MASLTSASRRNSASSASSSCGRRSSRMDSLSEEDHSSVFRPIKSGGDNSLTTHNPTNDPTARHRSPSLPVVSTTGGIARSRSPSLPVSPNSPETVAVLDRSVSCRSYSAVSDRSDSGVSDCSRHSSSLLSSVFGATGQLVIQEEDEGSSGSTADLNHDSMTNGSISSSSSSIIPGSSAQTNKSRSVVNKSRYSIDSAIDE